MKKVFWVLIGIQNEDLEIERSLSTVSLGWKFKSMMKFKDCF